MSIEAELRERLRLLELCVRGLIMELDEHGRYLDVWAHDEALLARPRSELIGATVAEVLGAESAAVFEELIRTTLERKKGFLEYQLDVPAGRRWFVCESVPGRRPRTVVLIIQDITERKQMEAQLLESDRLAAIGLLAGGVAHEINNPLAWLMTHLYTLQRELSRSAERERADLRSWSGQIAQAVEGAERIRRIVRDLSLFTRSPEEKSAPVDLRRALDWAGEIATAELKHRARLVKDYRTEALVAGSEARLGQVFLNLLLNAAQSIEPGRVEGNEVRFELAAPEPGRVSIDVVDTGAGIAPEHRARLFEPFFTTKPRGIGTGLGLSVSKRIIDSMGGSLELVGSRPGQTRFRVTLPTLPSSAAPPPSPAPRLEARAPAAKILVIDDEPKFLTSLRLALRDVLVAVGETSARAALTRIRQGEPFDAIVCDLMMPDLTGMDFFEALVREAPELSKKVVFMTGGAYTQRAREFLQAVPNPRLEKPFRPEELAVLLKRTIEAP